MTLHAYRNEENRTNCVVLLLLTRNSSDSFQTPHGTAICPRIYFVPKLHKLDPQTPSVKNLKMRPIVSGINSPTLEISHFIASIIKASIDQEKYNIKSSYQFIDLIKTINIPDGYQMISLDVVNMFGNITKEMVKDAVKERWHVISTNTLIDQDLFLQAVDLIFDANYFAFNDEFYKMIIGTTMGGRASVDVCDLVMDCLLDKYLAIHKNEVIMAKKFVDDLFLIIKTSAIPELIKTFNMQHQTLKFTSEIEVNGKLAYLDLLLIHSENQIFTKWYKKESTSNRMLCFNSAHSMNQNGCYTGNTDNHVSHR